MRGTHNQQGVPVRLCFGDQIRCQRRATASPIVYYHLSPKDLSQLVSHRTCDKVSPTAGWKWNDQPYGRAARSVSGSGLGGLFNTYVRTRTPKWDMLLDEFGTRFRFLDAHTFKVWPACNRNRATLAATLHLRQAHNIQPEDVESITVIGGTAGTQLLCEPLKLKRRPQTSIAGKYSIPFTAAVMMIKGEVSIRAYTDEGLRDPAVLAMADRIRYDPTGQSTQRVSPPTVEIRLKDGRVLSHQAQGAPGDARNPLDRASRIAKFRDCVSFSANPVTAGNINRVIDQVENLENLADATEIIRLLAPHE